MEKYESNNGHLGLLSVETLYSFVQKVYLKSKNREEKSKNLRLTVELKSELALSPGKVLCLQITDDYDCTFFYSLLLCADDFTLLKCQQGLLVDFDHFPEQLIKLLEVCKSQDVTNKFLLVLDEEDLQTCQNTSSTATDCIFLKVIETNNFKNLCHLSLKVKQGSDKDVKNHMSIKISNLNEKLNKECKKNSILEKNLNDALQALDLKSRELNDLKLKVAEEKNTLRLETSHQISEERERVSKLQMDWQQKLDLEKGQLVLQYQKQLNDLNEQINLLTFNNKNLYESRCQLETSVKEKNFQVENLDKQILQLSQEMTLLRKQNAQLDQDYHEKDKLVVGLKTKLVVIEQELKEKTKLYEKQQELLKSATEQKLFLEDVLSERDSNLQRKQAAVQNLSTDLMKCNEIIAKLQGDLTANKAKMKLRTDIALEQEKVLEKKNQQISAQEETIKELNDNVLKLTEELGNAKAKLEIANKKLEEKENTIKKNDNVINWLNRRLTESNPISSSRTETDFIPSVSQPKGNISNLYKGWPPWLINSLNGNSFKNDTTGGSGHVNRLFQSTNENMQSNIGSSENVTNTGDKNFDVNGKPNSEKARGLDPKYFKCSNDTDFITNSHILQANHQYINANSKDNQKLKEIPNSTNGQKQVSAYFPKSTITS